MNSSETKGDRLEARYQALRKHKAPGWYSAEDAADSWSRWETVLAPYLDRKGLAAELGSGAGNVSLNLAALGWWVVGFELSPTAVEWAMERAELKAANAQFVVRDLSQPLDLLESYLGACDLVLDGDCLHYMIGKARGHFLNNAHSLLTPDGIFVLRTTVGQPPESAWDLLGYIPGGHYCAHDGIPMTYCAEVDEVLTELKDARFSVVSSEVRPGTPGLESDVLTVVARSS